MTIPALISTHLQTTQHGYFDVHHSLLLPLLVHLIVDEAAKSSSLVLHICNHKPKSRHPSEKHGTKGSFGVYKHLTMVKHLSKVLYLIIIRNYSAQLFFKELNSSNITKQQAFSDM